MGIAERREREKSMRRQSILSCARELIVSQGVERVSMEDIAQKAELSKTTLYLYFPSKEVIFNEICEESARGFLEYFSQQTQPDNGVFGGLTGIDALRHLWRSYVKLFGNSDEMMVIFQIRNFLSSWPSSGGYDEGGDGDKDSIASKSPHVAAIAKAISTMIEQCKAEGTFDPSLNSFTAVRLVFMVFSTIMQNAVRLEQEDRNSPAMIREMTDTFQIIIRGFAKEGVEHSRLDISCPM